MSQNMQQGTRTGVALQTVPDARDAEAQAQVDTLKIVACCVCRAVYVPMHMEEGPYALPALEAAFLEVCHFCFRCQRPACPQCWNPVHHACAACSEEALLPFRSPVPSLEGLVFPVPAPDRAHPASRLAFTCQRNGRFYTAGAVPPPHALPDPGESATTSAPAVVSAPPAVSVPAAHQEQTHASSPAVGTAPTSYPTWLQEVLGQRELAPAAPVFTAETRPAHPSVVSAAAPLASPAPPAVFQAQEEPAFPMSAAPVVQAQVLAPAEPEAAAPVEKVAREEEEFSVFERIENILIVITSVLLLAVVLMIVLSVSFAQVNTFFLSLLHIDIRTEIAYLLQLR